ncbi:hypothetical protein ACFQY4_34215 [Catellatospora bangladeshensis]|uniref:hypothetical protein n=1 Tax=Catellatospora bangladeshensis TaxID=310355 RepID=UPI00360C4020
MPTAPPHTASQLLPNPSQASGRSSAYGANTRRSTSSRTRPATRGSRRSPSPATVSARVCAVSAANRSTHCSGRVPWRSCAGSAQLYSPHTDHSVSASGPRSAPGSSSAWAARAASRARRRK